MAVSACASTIAGNASMGGASARPSGVAPTASQPTTLPSGQPSGQQPSNSPTAQSGAAQYRTVDPCSFFTKSAFNDLGQTVTPTVATADYSSCSLSVSVTGASPRDIQSWSVYLDMGGSYSQPSDYKTRYSIPVQQTQQNGVPIVSGSDPTAGCLRGFSLPDSTSVVMVAKPTNSSTKGDPCKVAAAALNSALQSYRNNSLTQLQLSPGSIAAVDPCAAFTAAATRVVSGGTAKPIGEHGCQWSNQQSSVSVNLQSTDWPPSFLAGAPTQSLTLSGHAVEYAGQAMNGRSLVTAYLDMGASVVGPQGSHDAVTLTLIRFGGGGGSIEQQVTQFFTTSLPGLPKR
jgi:hypothetical protein